MADNMRKAVSSCLRDAYDLIKARGYAPDAWDQIRHRKVNIRVAVGLKAPDYDVHIATLRYLSDNLPATPRGHRFSGIHDWETYKKRNTAEILTVLGALITRLENHDSQVGHGDMPGRSGVDAV